MKQMIIEVKKIGYDWYRAFMVILFVSIVSQFISITKAGESTPIDRKVIDSARGEIKLVNNKLDYLIRNSKHY